MNEESAKKQETDNAFWTDERAKFEIRPRVYANTATEKNAVTLEVAGDYFSAFTNMSYEAARDLAQWILNVTDQHSSKEKA